ncbi:MAG: nitroreductase family protein [Candidatus Aenigmarchaeota archaeon]|nr:nitroreductase family protein [Candidatus Aenigmarchaeota archaeon]MBU5688869.1 nitroreductase family protein [Candidatus Aenigmarchaeota archaeon]
MELFEAMETRVNVKVYDKRDVPEELIAQILHAGTLAASAGDIQPWEFIVVKDKKTKIDISVACLRQRHVEEAPLLIVVCANLEKVALKFGDRGKNLYAIQDTGASIQNMLLAAHDLGLGASWVHAFEEEGIKRILKIPDKLRPVGVLAIGFPLPYEKYYKTEVIPFENISWSEEYGKELEWFYKETWKNRFGIKKSIYQTVKEIQVPEIKKEENKEIQQTQESKVEKKQPFSEKIFNWIKKLSGRKT